MQQRIGPRRLQKRPGLRHARCIATRYRRAEANQNGCASCSFLEFRIEDLATLGEVYEIGALVVGPPPLPSGQLAFADFDGTPTPLPIGDFNIMAAAGIGALETRSFDQGGSFEAVGPLTAASPDPALARQNVPPQPRDPTQLVACHGLDARAQARERRGIGEPHRFPVQRIP